MQLQRDERDSDSARIEALLDEHQALFLCTVSKNGGGEGAQARLGLQKSSRYMHIEVDFQSSAEGIAEAVRALVRVGLEVKVALDYYWLPRSFLEAGTGYGAGWGGKAETIIQAGASSVVLPGDKHGLMESMLRLHDFKYFHAAIKEVSVLPSKRGVLCAC